MRFLVLLCAITSSAISAGATATAERVQETSGFAFYSAFWPNLHHTLYAATWTRRPHTTARPKAGPLPEPLEGALTADERAAWEAAIAYYERELADRDLLFDYEMATIKQVVAAAGETLPEKGLPAGLREVLLKAAPVYRRYWWGMHDRANRAWIADVAPRVATLAPEITPRLAKLMQTPWFAQPVRVDVVRVGNSQGAYTSLRPTHITVSSGESNDQQWSGAEILFHEASHALIRPIIESIDAAGKTSGKQTGDLWHVVLFWTVGDLVREALEQRKIAYSPYIYATGLFQRAWPQFEVPVEKEWAPYVAGKISLNEAVTKLVATI
jgi:hypothetical protein